MSLIRESHKPRLLIKFFSDGKNFPVWASLLLAYAIILSLDIYLVNWYERFYNSILSKDTENFTRLVIIFLGICLMQATANGALSYLSELLEIRLKIFLSEFSTKSVTADPCIVDCPGIDQRIIDDPIMASERLSNIFPAIIFHSSKVAVFLFLMGSADFNVNFFGAPISGAYILIPFSIFYLIAQILVTSRTREWMARSEDMKRRAEWSARKKIFDGDPAISSITESYVKFIRRIRIIIGRAHGATVFSVNIFSLSSFIFPFILIFDSYAASNIDFGQAMRIAAIYSAFQSSSIYIFMSYKELFRAFSAIHRIERAGERYVA